MGFMPSRFIPAALLALSLLPGPVWAVEAAPALTDREIVERLTRLEGGQSAIRAELGQLRANLDKQGSQFRADLALPCPVLSCSVLPCPALSSPVLSCPVLSCPVLSCPVLSCPVLHYPALPCPALPCPALPCPALPLPIHTSTNSLK